MELDSEKQNLKHFVLPAVVSVFMWMMSISYYLLSLVMNSTDDNSQRLVFKDNSIEKARSELHASLRRRLTLMERSSTQGTGRNRVTRPHRPPPPPPVRQQQTKSEQISAETDKQRQTQAKTAVSLPPIHLRGQNSESQSLNKSGSSLRIKIKESDKTRTSPTFQARNNKSNSQRAAETQLQSQRAQVSASVSQIASLAEVDLGTRA